MSDEREDTTRPRPGDKGATMGSTAAYAAFRGWLEAEERAAALANRPEDGPEYDAAVSASSSAVRRLAAAPAMNGRDMALKLYALAHVRNPPGRDAAHPCALGELPPVPAGDDTEEEALGKAAARDALTLWPALARLATGDAGAFSEAEGESSDQRATPYHPDAELLDAWTRYVAGWRVIDALSAAGRDRDDDPDRIAAYASIDAADAVLLNAPWHTPAGLVVKLRRMVILADPSMAVYLAVIHGQPIPADELAALSPLDRLPAAMLQHAEALATVTAAPAQGVELDHTEALLADAVAALDKARPLPLYELGPFVAARMAAVVERNRSAEPDPRTDADLDADEVTLVRDLRNMSPGERINLLRYLGFRVTLCHLTDAMEEFAHETGMTDMYRRAMDGRSKRVAQPTHSDPFAATVAEFEQAAAATLPTVPTLGMIEAGATAAGIDADAVRAVYAAMAQAHQHERAA